VRRTRPRDLVIALIIAGILVNLLMQQAYSSLPHLPIAAGAVLAALAVVEFLLTVALRPRLRGEQGARPVEPLTAVRVVVLAKASSVLGAVMVGAWAGVLGYVLPRADRVAAAAHDTTAGIVGVLCAAALTAAALWLEHNCRLPDDRDDDPDDGGPGDYRLPDDRDTR
jgi:predicted outer membrane lipoprotein